jgi:hypothetical protein
MKIMENIYALRNKSRCPWADAEKKIRGGKDVLSGAKFVVK